MSSRASNSGSRSGTVQQQVSVKPERQLADCPTNLKEAVDWLLRLTNKDGQGGRPNEGKIHARQYHVFLVAVNELAKEVEKLLKEVQGFIKAKDGKVLSNVLQALANDKLFTLSNINFGGFHPGGIILQLSDGLAEFIGYYGAGINGMGIGSNSNENTYKSSYKGAQWERGESAKYALIFLGCIPIMFFGLSYLYWQCSPGTNEQNRRWTCDRGSHKGGLKCQAITDYRNPICVYLQSMGYNISQINSNSDNHRDAGFLLPLLQMIFMEYDTTTTSLQNDSSFNGACSVFVNNLLQKVKGKDLQKTYLLDQPITYLYATTVYYFQAIQNANKMKPCELQCPTSIREMLYWMMTLPYSPMYSNVKGGTLAALSAKKEIELIKGDANEDIVKFDLGTVSQHLFLPCVYAGFLQLTIGGHLKDDRNPSTTPFLYGLYSNSHFKFHYPDDLEKWVNVTWDVVYALYYQLNFLWAQCRTCVSLGCGWKWCQYGSTVRCDNILTWLCSGTGGNRGYTTEHHSCDGDGCVEGHGACTTSSGQCSPLQAFLCDSLPNIKYHIFDKENECPYCHTRITQGPYNHWCPIRMGYVKSDLSSVPRTGYCLFIILEDFVKMDTGEASLYNLMLCVYSVRTYIPRNPGDLFGLFFSLSLSADNTGRGDIKNLKTAVEEDITGCFWEYSTKLESDQIVNELKSLGGNGSGSKSHTYGRNHSPDLKSLRDCGVDGCGRCLLPLTRHIYSTFATKYSKTYTSWILYLTNVLHDGLKDLSKAFGEIKCKYCKKKPKCQEGCHNSDTETQCACVSMAACDGVLQTFYKFGFTFADASSLNVLQTRKSCSDFADHLSAVIDGDPFGDLIKAINDFFIHIRLPFIITIAALWVFATVYLIYAIILPLDILHISSHWRLSSSHKIPPFRLLSEAAPPKKIWYFKL
ncbi:uncharacterized protein BXIN_0212 [Babesia sp. Xinjiang]|uniref:uncharacterized protein n=1 Tax=Babesia sp. Xinjiang TaxID=462227 RepID=UPI000A253BD3|nr:uncharacterized protein BXIN_0212 [Babesia sp. Xinjiang]ORM39843.1 hypothetical protein BXIN_0212 [Babesia sp. Xinjiang]